MTNDSLGMLEALEAMPEQLASAATASRVVLDIARLPDHDDISNIVLCGVGTAGHACSFVLEAVGPTIPVPIVVHRGYGLPNFVDDSTLVVAVSLGGDTAETVDAVQLAIDDGAAVACVTSGGELARVVVDAGGLVLPVVADVPNERAAFAALTAPAMLLLERIGFDPGATAWIDDAIEHLARRRDVLVGERSPSRGLARALGRSFPLIYGGNGPGGMLAALWKSAFNEGAKVAAFHNVVPALTHDEIAGWGQDGDVTRQVFQTIFLRHDFEHPSVAQRLDVVEELMVEVVGDVHVVVAEGDGLLSQMYDMALFGLLTSVYAAFAQDVDPGPVPIIDEIDSRVGERAGPTLPAG